MCGVLGLFTGCAAVTFCPVAALRRQDDTTTTAPAAASEYRSAFNTWHERASVRSAARRSLDDDPTDVRMFSPDLVPVARHRLVQQLPEPLFDAVLTQHLYRYLDFTTKLEVLVVNRTALGIALGTIGVAVPEQMRHDAFKIYCDEAYHALFSNDMRMQVQHRTGVKPLLPEKPYFMTRLRHLQQQKPEQRDLLEILFVIVSETLISATLANAPDDPTVAGAVRQMIDDHAIDEGRHHAYFAHFLTHLWASLPRNLRIQAALAVPDLILAFLAPDRPAIHAELRQHGMRNDDAHQVISEVFGDDTVTSYARATARQTIRHFTQLGALELPGVAEQFHDRGLLIG